jgi:excisionase family DNA binding protein
MASFAKRPLQENASWRFRIHKNRRLPIDYKDASSGIPRESEGQTMGLEVGVPKFFTFKQVAEILNIPKKQVKQLAKEGWLFTTSFEKKKRISEEALLEYIMVVG